MEFIADSWLQPSCVGSNTLHIGLGVPVVLYAVKKSVRASSIPILLASCQKTCMTYSVAVCTVKNP
jgi:hypothetical protein